MVEYTVDFEGVNDYWGFYRAIINALDFPYWCGRNADAIWDMLTGHMEYPDVIYFRNFNSLPKSLDGIKTTVRTAFEEAATFYKTKSYQFEIID